MTVIGHHRPQAGGGRDAALAQLSGNIIDSMPSVLVGVDVDGCVTQWNPAAERGHGGGIGAGPGAAP